MVEPAFGLDGRHEGAFVDECGPDGRSGAKRKQLDLAADLVHDAGADLSTALDLHDADGALRLVEQINLASGAGYKTQEKPGAKLQNRKLRAPSIPYESGTKYQKWRLCAGIVCAD